MREKIKVIFQVFPKPTDKLNDTNYRIFKCSPMNNDTKLKTDKNFMFSVKGDLSYLNVGEEIDCNLELIETNRYGSTYKIKEIFNFGDFSQMSYEEKKNILTTIASERNAITLLQYYPNFLDEMLNFGKDYFDLSKLKGIKKAKISSYERQLFNKYKYYGIMQSNKLYDVTLNECKTLISEFKTNEGINMALQENPYRVLIDVLGRKFVYQTSNGSYNGVDKLLCEIRPDLKDSDVRCEYMMIHTLELNEDGDGYFFKGGSTRLNGKKVYEYCKSYAPELCSKMKDVAISCDGIYIDEQTNDMAKMSTYLKEVKIRDFFESLLKNNIQLDWNWQQFKELKDGQATEEQQAFLKEFCENRLTILNCGAGRGKTFGTKLLIDMIEYYGLTYSVQTFTGKASKRFIEATGKKNAHTIHKTSFGGGTNADVIIWDEMSMGNNELMCMFIDSIHQKDTCRVVLIGDLMQAPPINSPSVVKEFINSKLIKPSEYTKCFRFNNSGIAQVSTNCREGKMYISEQDYEKDEFIYGKDKDYKFIKFDNTLEQIVEVYENALKKFKVEDITILSPWNVKDFGTININNHIQSVVNPPIANEKVMIIKKSNTDIAFRKGDLVINCKNKYDCMSEDIYNEILNDDSLNKEDFKHLKEVANGAIGKVLQVTDTIIKILFEDEIIIFTKNDVKDLLLAYSVSLLKMQGSSNKCIIQLTLPQHKNSLNRQLLYTALTRASNMLIEIGDIKTIQHSVQTLADTERETFLKDLLQEIKINT